MEQFAAGRACMTEAAPQQGLHGLEGLGGLDGMDGGISVNFGAAHPAPARALARSGSEATHVRPFITIEAAIAAIESLDRELRKFELAVADGLQDYLGVQMAQITDCALARGWEPISFLQKDGFRLYRYEAMRSSPRRGRRR